MVLAAGRAQGLGGAPDERAVRVKYKVLACRGREGAQSRAQMECSREEVGVVGTVQGKY